MVGLTLLRVVSSATAACWLYLAVGHGRFWSTAVRLPPPGPAADPSRWPSVVAVVPARDEARMLPHTLPTLVGQSYPGPWQVLVVDDDSGDDTASVARDAGARVVRSPGPPPGWTGKVAAMAAGVQVAGAADWLLFTDADITWSPGALTELVRSAGDRFDLVSQMVRLRVASRWERLVVPAFVYFFAQLYPFARVGGRGRTAAAAGGCMLVRRAALENAGGLAAIRDAAIDDVALARALKRNGRVWLGLAAGIDSARPYPALADLWRMVSRSAYTQLRHSPGLLAGTVIGLLFVYAAPPVTAVAGLAVGDVLSTVTGLAAWVVMTATFVPMLHRYRLRPWRALLLPAVALLYLAMTLDSARAYRAGRGATWKGRVAAPR